MSNTQQPFLCHTLTRLLTLCLLLLFHFPFPCCSCSPTCASHHTIPHPAFLRSGIKQRLRELKSLMPVRLKWVKGHQKGAPTEHGNGNNEAHNRAMAANLESVEQLPTGPQGEVVADEAALKAAWSLFVSVRSCGKQQQKLKVAKLVAQHKKQKKKKQQKTAGLQKLGKKAQRRALREAREKAAKEAQQKAEQQEKRRQELKARQTDVRLQRQQDARQQLWEHAQQQMAQLRAAAAAATATSTVLHTQQMPLPTASLAPAPCTLSGLQYVPHDCSTLASGAAAGALAAAAAACGGGSSSALLRPLPPTLSPQQQQPSLPPGWAIPTTLDFRSWPSGTAAGAVSAAAAAAGGGLSAQPRVPPPSPPTLPYQQQQQEGLPAGWAAPARPTPPGSKPWLGPPAPPPPQPAPCSPNATAPAVICIDC